MNRTVFAIAALASVSALFAGGDALAAASLDQFGGEISLWPENHGSFRFVNRQDAVASALFEKPIARLANDFSIDISLLDGCPHKESQFAPLDIRKIPAALKGLGAKGGVWIVNDPALPLTLSATEDGWGVLNVAPILADSPDSTKLAMRITKIVYRLFASLNGIGDSTMMPACVMKPAVGLVGIDRLVCATYSPEANSKITTYLALSGYKTRKTGTYYDACEEGWAPAPTNAVQKAIWEKVHQLPTKPLTIKPEK